MTVRNIRVPSVLPSVRVELDNPSETPPIVQYVTDLNAETSVLQDVDVMFIRGEADNTVYVAIEVATGQTEGVLTIIEI